MLISNSLLYFRWEECEHISVCVFVCVIVCVCASANVCVSKSLASPAPLGFELVEAREISRPRDNPSGLFPYKTYGKMQKLFFPFSAHKAINISHRTFAHVPLRTGIPAETQSSWKIKRGSQAFLHSNIMHSMCATKSRVTSTHIDTNGLVLSLSIFSPYTHRLR